MVKPQLIFVGSRWLMSSVAIIADLNGLGIKGILDHHYYGNKSDLNGIPYIGDERWLLDKDNDQAQSWIKDCVFFPANWHSGQHIYKSGPNLVELRNERIRILEESGARVTNLIHPNAVCMSDASHRYSRTTFGKGILIQGSAYVGPDNNHIGDYCQIEAATHITHDVTLGKNVQVAPKVFISNGCNINIGDDSYLGARMGFDFKLDRNIDINVGKNVTVWTNALVKRHTIPDDCIYTDSDRVLKKFK